MDLVRGYKFFSPDECEKVRAYCDKKERKLEALLNKQAIAMVKASNGIPMVVKMDIHIQLTFFWVGIRHLEFTTQWIRRTYLT